MAKKTRTQKTLLHEEIMTELNLFEAVINEQIVAEEPLAPRVHVIVNKPKSELDIPPWEYVYTNRLL